MDFHYQINHEKRLVLAKRRGSWGLQDFIDSFESMRAALATCQSYDLVSDLREAQAQFTLPELKQLATTILQHPLTAGETLLLVNKPTETALAMLYKNAVMPVTKILIFSTLEGASEHVGTDLAPLLEKL